MWTMFTSDQAETWIKHDVEQGILFEVTVYLILAELCPSIFFLVFVNFSFPTTATNNDIPSAGTW